jgi:signal transduction histidine kinase
VKGLYGQLMAVTSAVLVVAVGISLWVLYAFGVTTSIATARSTASADIVAAAQAAASQLAGHGGLDTATMVNRERQLGGVLTIVDRQGDDFWSYPAGHSLRDVRAHLTQGREQERVSLIGRVVWAAAKVPYEGRQKFVVWRVPVVPPAFPTPTQVGVMVSGLAAIVLAQVLWALVARRLTSPLEALLAQLDRYGQGDFSARAQIRAPDEFMRLAEAMGRMGDALQQERTAREAFLAEVAHDLRTPLTALRSLLGSLTRDTDPVQARDRLRRAERESERLTRLVNDLLDLARHETGHLSVALARVDLREVTALGAVSGEAAAEARGVAFEVSVPDKAVWVRADLDRGAQILVNLVDNAVRYTPPGGRVRVRVAREGDQGALWVEDTGPGFEPGATDWAWSAFTRGKAARENDGGTGLGLAVGRALAEVMGGDLRIMPPAPGLGARVRLGLAVADDDPARPSPRARPGQHASA